MSSQPLLIDNIAFAKKGDHLSGSLLPADCPRLMELLASQAPDAAASKNVAQERDRIDFTLDGEINALGQRFLHLSLQASLTTVCQRCLDRMPLTLDLNFHYLITDSGAGELEVGELDGGDDFDLQEASQSMDVAALIEDEIIMAVPIAPVHEHDCSPHSMQSGERANPFAVLKGLIKS